MQDETVGKLIDQWMADANFRESMRKDPQAAIREMGIQLTDDELKALSQIDWQLSDEELQTRISRGRGAGGPRI
jgi:hypothetical protein